MRKLSGLVGFGKLVQRIIGTLVHAFDESVIKAELLGRFWLVAGSRLSRLSSESQRENQCDRCESNLSFHLGSLPFERRSGSADRELFCASKFLTGNEILLFSLVHQECN